MFFKQPSIHIDKVENLEINTRLHPFWEEEFYHYLKGRQQGRLLDGWPTAPPTEIKEQVWLKILDYGGKIVSILSGIAVIAFVVLLWSGRTAIGSVQIGTLLTVISFHIGWRFDFHRWGKDVFHYRQPSKGQRKNRTLNCGVSSYRFFLGRI